MSEDTRNALNALLYNTGSASHRLMMVLATNRAEVSTAQPFSIVDANEQEKRWKGAKGFISCIILHILTVLPYIVFEC